jgi:hypothetical protein
LTFSYFIASSGISIRGSVWIVRFSSQRVIKCI